MHAVKSKRRKKLIDPGLQLRMVGAFMALSALALMLQFLLFARNLAQVAAELPQDGALLLGRINGLLARTLGFSLAVVLPMSLMVGVLLTFKVAGPLYRFRVFLGQVKRGERPADCKIRRGDELQDFCTLLNETTRPLRIPVANATSTAQRTDGLAA